VAGWPSLDRVDDRHFAESLGVGDTHAMAQIYDGYSEPLYDYCHALLRDQDSAAGALHDALIAAQAHIGKLREPERFRGWLYALVRNECLRRMYDPARPTERREALEVEDPFIVADDRTRLEETRQLVHSALSGLNGRQREAIDLALRHDLDVQELGGVLGISIQQATELAGEARSGLDDALAAAIIARSGRGECPSVAALVDTWEWPLTPAVCKKLIRHIETCPICGERRSRKVSTTRLLQVLPVAMVPPELRQHVLTTATDASWHDARNAIAQRAEPFDESGWPGSVDRDALQSGRSRQRTPRLWPALAAAACVMFVVGAVFLYLPRSAEEPAGGPAQGAVAGAEPSSPEIVSPSEEEDGATETAEPTNTPSTAPPTTRVPTTRRPATTRRPTTRRPPARPAPANPQPRPGTLSVSGCGEIGQARDCTLTVTAVGGGVDWSVSGVSEGLSASGGGHLESGDSATVDVDVVGGCSGGRGSGSVSFSPNGGGTVSWEC
jgi:RNA polymerase sigma factor (sigma-70 family)